jgi:uncharacterized integral membrane protein
MTEPRGPAPLSEESRLDRTRRHAHRTKLYLSSALAVAALVYLIALIVANTDHVKASWVFGSGKTSLVWLIVFPALLGWLLGIVTAFLYRRRTRRPR